MRYAHFLGVMALGGCLLAENLLLGRRLAPATLRRLAVIDAGYGASAMLVLAAGLALWWWQGKAPAFYHSNPVFLIKLALFAVLALLSIYPTVFFLRHRGSRAALTVPSSLVYLLRLQLLLLPLLPLLAVMMARGVGLN